MTDFSKEETSLSDIYITTRKLICFLLNSKKIFFVVFFVIFLLKFITFYLSPDTYLAKMSFVIENSSNSESNQNSGGLSNVASQFGVNIPGSNGSTVDYISSKNLNTFFTSFSIVSKVLHKKFNEKSNLNFAQAYAKIYKYDLSLNSNELDHIIYENIVKNEFKIEPIKGSSFLEVKTEMRSPELSIFFEKTILNEAIQDYTKLKTGKQTKILEKTQKTLDSITLILNNKSIVNYKKQEALFNSNQSVLINRVVVDESARDKQYLLTMYGQIVTQLNTTKLLINQETPYVQILDDIQTPIYTSKNTIFYGTIVALIFGMFSAIIFISIIYFLNNNNEK
ncbi:MAG: hypothetical protein K9I82_08315 [Chitinophagaceae bacterium]|nr:hypothetical protein [Chitinophagaceae bacterium]